MKAKYLFSCLVCAFILLFAAGSALASPIVKSDSNYFDINTGCYILQGNVYIETGSRTITADMAQVNPLSLEVWGNGNITVKQDDILFTGSSVYVCGKNKTASITGGVNLSRSDLSISADSVFYSWETKRAVFKNASVNDRGNAYSADTVNYNMATNEIE
jgi:lipopolysaccharide export system protein LptA